MGDGGLRNGLAMLLHKMPRLRDQERRRTSSNERMQCHHDCRTQHRILDADRHQRLARPLSLPEFSRLDRYRRTIVLRLLGHHCRERAQGRTMAAIRKRRLIGGALLGA